MHYDCGNQSFFLALDTRIPLPVLEVKKNAET
jgi:hypothetical protein